MAKTERSNDLALIRRRNQAVFDVWSIIHLATGVLLGWIMSPFIALLLMVLWEPFEVLILSPMLAKRNIIFGRESLQNSLSDIFFDALGVGLGFWLLANLFSPPFYLNI